MAAVAAGLLLALAPGLALAQNAPAAALDDSEASTAEDRLVLLNFSRCVAQRQPTQVRALIISDYTTDAYRDARRRLATSQYGCLPTGGRLRVGGVLFTGDLAEILLGQTVPHGTLAARTALNPAAAPFHATDQGELMSLCLIRAVPAETEALLASEHGSEGELAALRAIGPHIGGCLASGAQMRINRPGLRALLALSAYRLVQHNVTASTAAAAGN